MAIAPRLDLRQSQQLVMTPQLQQAIKLLALTNLELDGFISEELEKNPLLEVGTREADPADQGQAQPPGEENAADAGTDGPAGADELLASDAVADGGGDAAALDVDYDESLFQHNGAADSAGPDPQMGADSDRLSLSGTGAVGSGAVGFDDEGEGFAARLVAETSLADHLHRQVGEQFSDAASRLIATAIIDQIDEAGYFRGDCLEIAAQLELACTDVEAVLAQIQRFDPAGVGARSLSECLKLQAAEADRLDPAMACLLDHLDLLARGEMAQLKRLCRVDDEDLADMIRELRQYNPKPGLAFGETTVQTVVPDIFIRRAATGGWQVELNTATLPRVLVDRTYYAQLSGRASRREDKLFLSECLQSANWLVKALDQRARTILKVSTELLRQQEEFFEQGVRALRPLTLRSIAEAVDMHESTISRVTNGKYLSCPRGVFELKYFFTSAIQSADGGDAHSAEAVKDRIRALIDAESPKSVLSDDKLVEILQREKFDIARRTVAKYREALRIPSSVQRRRMKALALSAV